MNPPPVARLTAVTHRYDGVAALDGVSLEIPAGVMAGLIGPDGVGKSTLLALLAGARRLRQGSVEVLGHDPSSAEGLARMQQRIAYMPQGLGSNLSPSLTVAENLDFFASLFGHDREQRRRRVEELTRSTGLHAFLDRPAGHLSGGMKQKLGLCCALIHEPDLLILDEPTTGVDPLARSRFRALIAELRRGCPGMSVIVATAYMEEAERFDWLAAMDAGRVLACGSPAELRARTGAATLDGAFIDLLPEVKRRGHRAVVVPPATVDSMEVAIEAHGLTVRFGDFTAVDRVSFRIRRGEIFGFVGSNGCGKTTTMKALTGLLRADEGGATLFGREVSSGDLATRRRVGYMSQSFSLYRELTVRQNLELHARLFGVPRADRPARVAEMLERFGLAEIPDALPDALPPGIRQRLSLAVAMVHKPELLILDEPTSGVDPVARDNFWRHMIDLARRDRVTIFVSTHFMSEAERCDRISLMHAGKVLVTDSPAEIVSRRGAANLEEAFIGHLMAAGEGAEATKGEERAVSKWTRFARGVRVLFRRRLRAKAPAPRESESFAVRPPLFNFSAGRMFSYTRRELQEFRHDPVRAAMALVGSLLLMVIMGYGLSMDVEDLTFAVLDRDRTPASREYAHHLSGSRYFVERPPIADYAELDRRMRSGELAMALEFPSGFGRDVRRGRPVSIGAWIDGAMPARAETVLGYVRGMHAGWLDERAHESSAPARSVAPLATVETRFRYNPEVRSLPAMVPAVIPLLLLMIPSMLAALSVVREKEMGSIVNLYVTPVTRTEFLLGKQLPYIGFAMMNFLLMAAMSVTVFGVPMKGDFATLLTATFVYVIISTGFGLLASTFTKSQIAAMFFAMVGTMLPAVQFAGMINPVSALEGPGRVIGEVYPATYMLIISRGVFCKALDLSDLLPSLLAMLPAVPVILGLSILLLRKQGR